MIAQRVSSGRSGYICLVPLSELNKFLRDESGQVSQRIFDDNVRDWQRLTPVNAGISKSLREQKDQDLWWLNNGITVLCADVNLNDDVLTVKNPQIVNGLQTCKEISQFFDVEKPDKETRTVLVKVIKATDDLVRDMVIRATNSQNSVSLAMLRATDDFQRQVEKYFLARGAYYDRRKGFYSGQKKATADIHTITFLVQSVLACMLFKPDEARARPSDPLKKEKDYKEVFDPSRPLQSYYVAAVLTRRVEQHLRKELKLSAKTVSNLRFYVSMVVIWQLSGSTKPSAEQVSLIDLDALAPAVINAAYELVKEDYEALGGDDDVARGSKLKAALKHRSPESELTLSLDAA